MTGLGRPEASDFGALFARRQGCGERTEPLIDRATGFGAIVTKLVDVAGRGWDYRLCQSVGRQIS